MRSVSITPSGDGRIEVDHRGTAEISRQRPGDASVVACTTVQLETPSGARVEVFSDLRATRDSVSLSGRVIVDHVVHFERRWRY
jgi:hypothetical protein